DGAAVTPELTLYGDLEFDEIEIYDLVMSVEDDFGIELPDEALEDMKTVGDLVSYVAKSIGY
ncbi:MAG: acyl carrier protein, partial [Clostridia bacterium]|nr:acyl carrier protein [Clostridia bacterium]